jgi:hypothetical protein
MIVSNADKILENYVDSVHVLDGRTLRPFSARHYFWLASVESPLIYTDRPLTHADISQAAQICSATTNEEIAANLKKAERRAAFWRKNRVTRTARRIARHFQKGRSLADDVKIWADYHEDFCSLPVYEDCGGGVEKIPWLFCELTRLIRATGWSEETVWTMPLGRIIWLNATLRYLENNGETPVMSDNHRRIEAMALEMMAAANKGKEAQNG